MKTLKWYDLTLINKTLSLKDLLNNFWDLPTAHIYEILDNLYKNDKLSEYCFNFQLSGLGEVPVLSSLTDLMKEEYYKKITPVELFKKLNMIYVAKQENITFKERMNATESTDSVLDLKPRYMDLEIVRHENMDGHVITVHLDGSGELKVTDFDGRFKKFFDYIEKLYAVQKENPTKTVCVGTRSEIIMEHPITYKKKEKNNG